MSQLSRPIIYVAILACVAVALFSTGIIPTPVSAAERIAIDWQDAFAARHRISDDGKVVRLTVGSPDFTSADCQQLVALADVKKLDLSGTSIDDGALSYIAEMKSLESLRLDGTTISDEGLGNLAALATLKELSLSRCKLGPLTQEGLGSLTAIESLSLMNTPLADTDIEALKPLRQLKKLYLGETGISVDCLAQLNGLQSLQLLNVIGLSKGDEQGFVAIAELSALEFLYLDRSSITDESFTAFVNAAESNCKKLQAVFLEGCSIGDTSQEALTKLVSLPKFTKLRLTGTQVSRSVFDEIVQSSPDVSYAHGSGAMSED